MIPSEELKAPRSVVLYTNSLWESPMVTLRVVGPARQAGLTVIQGNQESQIFPERVASADWVVIQRDFPRYRSEYESVMSRARAEGKPVLYEVDDLLIDMPENHSHLEDYRAILLPLARAVIEADVVITTTQALADDLRSLNPNTWVMPNYLNDQLWDFRSPAGPEEESFPLVIGYMGGETHQTDIESVAPALRQLLSRYAGRVRLRFWGGRPPETLLADPLVEWIPLNELNYARFADFFMQQSCDILIAPLKDNRFNGAKSELKFLEYSALGAPGVYSRLPPYENIVEHGVNGFLASMHEDWESCLRELIESPRLRFQVSLKSQETVQQGWLLSQHAGDWLETCRKALDPENPLRALSQDRTGLLRLLQKMEGRQGALEREVGELRVQVEGAKEQLREVLESRSWRTLQKFQRARLRLFPPASRRERILKNLRILG